MCAIVEVLEAKYLKFPNKEDFIKISEGFWTRWNFPNCVGSIDGKHIEIQAPYKSGSEFYNYKNYFSVVLFAVCDAHYRFIYVDIGSYGSEGDAGIYASSTFGKALNENKLDLPEPQPLPNMNPQSFKFPYMFIGDEAFPLKPNIARPFGGKNLSAMEQTYNYRLSRARRVIENAFGILSSKWRVFRAPILLKPTTVSTLIKAACCLHNYLITDDITTGVRSYATATDMDSNDLENGSWREEQPLRNMRDITNRITSNRASELAIKQREYLGKYISSEKGRVLWQEEHINKGYFDSA